MQAIVTFEELGAKQLQQLKISSMVGVKLCPETLSFEICLHFGPHSIQINLEVGDNFTAIFTILLHQMLLVHFPYSCKFFLKADC